MVVIELLQERTTRMVESKRWIPVVVVAGDYTVVVSAMVTVDARLNVDGGFVVLCVSEMEILRRRSTRSR